ncbi:hypothetical protein D3C84_1005430 [compost metagenome]
MRELRRKNIALTLPDPFVAPDRPKSRAVRLCVGAECTEDEMAQGLSIIQETFHQYPKVNE